MAEYVYVPVQTVAVGQDVLLEDSIPCNRGLVFHRNGSGILTLRGTSNNANCCNSFARYQVTFNANIAVPATETAGPIELTLTQSGGEILSSKAIVTPTAVDAYFNVTVTAIITVPRCCCYDIAVENTSTIPVNVQNANLVVSRIA